MTSFGCVRAFLAITTLALPVSGRVSVDDGRPPLVYAIDPTTGKPRLKKDMSTELFQARVAAPIPASAGSIVMSLIEGLSTDSYTILSGARGFDLDHDGLREFVTKKGVSVPFNGTFYFYESSGDNAFSLAHTLTVAANGTASVLPRDVGDADGDGLSELAVARKSIGAGGYSVSLYESKSAETFPTDRVWTSQVTAMKKVRIADTDQDGAEELVVGGAETGADNQKLDFYENAGNDSYTLTCSISVPDIQSFQALGLADDVDGDGHDEILYAGFWNSQGGGSRVFMYESAVNNTYESVWSFDPTYQGAYVNLSVAVDGGDLDGDGKKEFLIGGLKPITQAGETFSLVMFLFEAKGDNQFEPVHIFVQPYGTLESEEGAKFADIDGDGHAEAVLGSGNTVRIYRCVGDDAWEEIWSATTGVIHNIGAGDHDGDGKEEIIFQGATFPTEVWEIDSAYAADPDADGLVDVIDNCPLEANAGQEDADTDGKGNVCDCAPADGTAFAVPGAVKDLTVSGDKTTLQWASLAGAAGVGTLYDLVYGNLTGLPVSSAPASCLEAGSFDMTAQDASLPAPGAGVYYLVRGSNACGVGTYGSDSSGSEQISAACP